MTAPNRLIRASSESIQTVRTGVSRVRSLSGCLRPCTQVAQEAQFLVCRRVGGRRLLRHLRVPARGFFGLLDGSAGVQGGEGKLFRLRVRAQHAEVGMITVGPAPDTIP